MSRGHSPTRGGAKKDCWNGRTAARVRARVAEGSLGAPGRGIALALTRGAALGAAQTAVGLALVLGVGRLLAGSPWSGHLDAGGLRIAAAAMAAVAGVRVLGLSGRHAAALGLGALAGIALVTWGGAA